MFDDLSAMFVVFKMFWHCIICDGSLDVLVVTLLYVVDRGRSRSGVRML